MSQATQVKSTSKLVSTIFLTVAAILWLLPTIGLFIVSFRESTESQSHGWWTALTKWSTDNWTLNSYRTVFDGANLGHSFISSFAVTLPATVLPLLFAAYAAYGFTFIKFRGREMDYPEIALEDLREIAQSLADISVIEQAPMMEGKTMLVVLGPAKAKLPKDTKEAKPAE